MKPQIRSVVGCVFILIGLSIIVFISWYQESAPKICKPTLEVPSYGFEASKIYTSCDNLAAARLQAHFIACIKDSLSNVTKKEYMPLKLNQVESVNNPSSTLMQSELELSTSCAFLKLTQSRRLSKYKFDIELTIKGDKKNTCKIHMGEEMISPRYLSYGFFCYGREFECWNGAKMVGRLHIHNLEFELNRMLYQDKCQFEWPNQNKIC